MAGYEIFSTVTGLGIGLLILFLVRKDHMHGAYAIWWTLAAIGITWLGLFPSTVNWLGRVAGVGYPPIIILVIAICLLLVKVLTMDLERSRQERQLRRLAQRLAVMEEDLRKLRSGASGEQ